jgi:membrane-bound lytic murein transglycosylase D
MDWNDLRSTSIYINQKLVVFIGEDREQAFVSRKVAGSKPNNISKEGFVYYTIERGDTLWSISKKFPGVAMDSIRRDNQIYNVHSLQPGTVLKIGLASNG